MSVEARSGFRRLVGTRVDGTIALTQDALLEALRQFPDIPRALTLRIEANNHVVLGYAGFQVGALLADAVDLKRKRLQLRLDSIAIGWALRYLIRSPGVIVRGRDVSIEFERWAVFATYRMAWDHIRMVALSTAPGAVRVRFAIDVV